MFGKSAAGTTLTVIYYIGMQLKDSEFTYLFSLIFIASISYTLNRNNSEKQSLEQTIKRLTEDMTTIATSSQIELDKAKTTIDLLKTVISSLGDDSTKDLIKVILESMEKIPK